MKKIVHPFLRTPYNYDTNAAGDETGISCPEPTKTQQHMVDDTDINKLVARYLITGEMPQLTTPPLQGDFTQVHTYQESMNLMIQAQRAFEALPAKIRSRFDHDPGQLVAFMSDQGNRDEIRQMGLWSPEAVKAWEEKAAAAKAAEDALKRDGEAYRAERALPPKGGKGGEA